jgi:hypothetical protein
VGQHWVDRKSVESLSELELKVIIKVVVQIRLLHNSVLDWNVSVVGVEMEHLPSVVDHVDCVIETVNQSEPLALQQTLLGPLLVHLAGNLLVELRL